MTSEAVVDVQIAESAQVTQAENNSQNVNGTKTAIVSFLAGGFGGMCLVAAGHPLDLAKVRMQTSNQYKSAFDVLSKTFRADGVRGLYRGMLAPLVGITPVYAVCFWGYDLGQKIARSFSKTDASTPLTFGQILFAGGFSAIPTTALMTPMERIKVILQIQGQSSGGSSAAVTKYAGPLDAAKGIFKQSGLKGLYKGSFATLLRDVPGSVAYFGAYEVIKKTLTPAGAKADSLSPVAVVVAGGLAGMANWAVAIPPDVLKTRLQTAPEGKYSGLREVFVDLWRNEGPKALFKGLGPAMIRAFPANAACFLGVEVATKALNSAL
ncbi:Mitochondrial carnitine/acylcarnitine carrier protein [Smittium culicis]|uniref:Mitochondrial carnitine/acylcarnitine carrier protein n=2 Tax=Smittium culicis TaxID=133412 RepID=A0A1R1XW02_9FUNG|nr:Mitochondrial carnitine/acylcarnitine carrier protein [Smittium culicis]